LQRNGAVCRSFFVELIASGGALLSRRTATAWIRYGGCRSLNAGHFLCST